VRYYSLFILGSQVFLASPIAVDAAQLRLHREGRWHCVTGAGDTSNSNNCVLNGPGSEDYLVDLSSRKIHLGGGNPDFATIPARISNDTIIGKSHEHTVDVNRATGDVSSTNTVPPIFSMFDGHCVVIRGHQF
jgi:hypothetical protein